MPRCACGYGGICGRDGGRGPWRLLNWLSWTGHSASIDLKGVKETATIGLGFWVINLVGRPEVDLERIAPHPSMQLVLLRRC